MQGYFQLDTVGHGKRERTRAALLDGAMRVIAAKGMENAKISDITETAGLANGTFYNHFEDKDEILREVAYGIAGEVGRTIDEQMVDIGDARTRVVVATSRFIAMAVKEPEWGAVLIGSVEHMPNVRKDIMQYLHADLELGVEQGVFDIRLDQFLLDQIAALVVVSIRLQMNAGRTSELTVQTCENILRLCGLSPAAASRTVKKAQKQLADPLQTV
jgi:AcrR family transcriptional regulator